MGDVFLTFFLPSLISFSKGPTLPFTMSDASEVVATEWSLGKSTNLGFFSKLFTKRGLFLNYLPMKSVFICIALKAGTQFNGELTCDIELLC